MTKQCRMQKFLRKAKKIAEENLFPKEPEENDLLDFSSGM